MTLKQSYNTSTLYKKKKINKELFKDSLKYSVLRCDCDKLNRVELSFLSCD